MASPWIVRAFVSCSLSLGLFPGMAAAAAIGCIGSYGIHLWGDIGFTEQPTIFLVGLAIAVTSQLSVSTGAWPERWRQYVRSSTASGPRRMSR